MSEDQSTAAVQDNTATATATATDTATTANTTAVDTTTTVDATTTATDTTTTGQTTDTTPVGAPEQYGDFALPEGMESPTDEFKTWAKSQNMTQEVAQSAVDFYTKTIVPQQQAAQEAQVEAWGKESETKHGKAGIEAANNALGRFSTPEFKEFLNKTGLGNHPDMIGIFKEINAKISESGFVEGQKGGGEKTAAQLLFGRIDK